MCAWIVQVAHLHFWLQVMVAVDDNTHEVIMLHHDMLLLPLFFAAATRATCLLR